MGRMWRSVRYATDSGRMPRKYMKKKREELAACAEIVGVNRNTVNSWYNDFRHKIMLQVLAETRTESGEFEVDESYFGAHRVRGKRGAERQVKLRFLVF